MKEYLAPIPFTRWLREQGATVATVTDVGMRAMWRWEHETKRPIPFYGVADRLLTQLEIHEWEIPDELWVDPPTCRECGTEVTGNMVRCQPCATARLKRRKAERTRKRREANRLIDRAFDGLAEHEPGDWRRKIAA